MGKECRDCKAERERRGAPPPKQLRRIKRAGRCHTHDLQFRRSQKASSHERRVQQVYGLAPGEYQRLYVFQGQVCAICRRATGKTRKLSVDHDHTTGLVRGLLCRPCNDLLGHLRDDPFAAQRLYRYLVNPPARHLGIEAVHQENRGEEPA